MVHILNSLFRQPQGYLAISDPDPTRSKGQKPIVEFATITCGHCGRIVKVDLKAAEPPTERCYGCGQNICLDCVRERARTMTCDVIEKKLERSEARARFHRAIGA
jgi:hypothetical protein